jgi:hypothetical protein
MVGPRFLRSFARKKSNASTFAERSSAARRAGLRVAVSGIATDPA